MINMAISSNKDTADSHSLDDENTELFTFHEIQIEIAHTVLEMSSTAQSKHKHLSHCNGRGK